jgi:hypothetical protein
MAKSPRTNALDLEAPLHEGAGRPLLHIGYHKTGTSWLQKFLFQNAEAGFMWSGKGTDSPVNRLVVTHPLDFSAKAARADFGRSIERARARRLTLVVSLERLSGHPFSGGYDSKEIADRLEAVFPDGRVLVVIREQRSMILSTYKQYLKAGGALALRHFLDPPTYRRPRVPHFDLRHFEYHRLLSHYRRLFGPNVLALPYEQLQTDPEGFATAIVQFAGGSLDPETIGALPFSERPNLAQRGSIVPWTRLCNRLFVRCDINPTPLAASSRGAALLARCAKTVDRLAPERLQEGLERRWRDAIREAVGDRFRDSNRASAKLTGLDLEAYGYDVAAGPSVDAEEKALELR